MKIKGQKLFQMEQVIFLTPYNKINQTQNKINDKEKNKNLKLTVPKQLRQNVNKMKLSSN